MEPVPNVSIVIATYNRAQLLPACIASVLSQTHRDFEVIIVDDGSTDETASVVGNLSDTRIHYFSLEKNGGAAAARNYGIAQARAPWVMVWDSDDELYPEALEKLLQAAHQHSDAGTISAPALPIQKGTELPWKRREEGYISVEQIVCKYLPANEKVRMFKKELAPLAAYRSYNLDFLVNAYLVTQAPWYHVAEPLGMLRIAGADSLTKARRKFNVHKSQDRAEHLALFLESFGEEVKAGCPARYSAYAYGASLGFLASGNTVEARRLSSLAWNTHRTLRTLGALLLTHLPGGSTILRLIG